MPRVWRGCRPMGAQGRVRGAHPFSASLALGVRRARDEELSRPPPPSAHSNTSPTTPHYHRPRTSAVTPSACQFGCQSLPQPRPPRISSRISRPSHQGDVGTPNSNTTCYTPLPILLTPPTTTSIQPLFSTYFLPVGWQCAWCPSQHAAPQGRSDVEVGASAITPLPGRLPLHIPHPHPAAGGHYRPVHIPMARPARDGW
jgi:hypothetical protein